MLFCKLCWQQACLKLMRGSIFAAIALTCTSGLAQEYFLKTTIENPNQDVVDFFGQAVDIDGNYAAVGAPRFDESNELVGRILIYDVNSGNLVRTIEDPVPSIGPPISNLVDGFGDALAIHKNYLAVGDTGDDSLGEEVGQTYLFDVATGRLLQTLNSPNPTGRDGFGNSVDINDDVVIVGAPFNDSLGTNGGQAYVFDRESGQLIHTLDDPTPSGTPFFAEQFGTDVAISGETLAISEAFAVHLFDLSSGELVRSIEDPDGPPKPQDGSGFGRHIDLNSDVLLVGSASFDGTFEDQGLAYLFDVSSGELIHTFGELDPSPDAGLGSNVAIASGIAVVGGIFPVVHLFDLSSGEQIDEIEVPAGGPGFDRFNIAADGNRYFFGARSFSLSDSFLGCCHFYVTNSIVGDVNYDGDVNQLDIAPFVALLVNGLYQLEGDINGDGDMDLLDIAPFVSLLSG